jgi:hypothetical protein
MIRRSFLDRNEIRYNEELRTGEDFDFFMRCFEGTRQIHVCLQPLYYYRIRADSTSHTRSIADWERIVDSNDRLIATYSGGQQAEVKRLLAARSRSIGLYIRGREIVDAIRTKKWRLAFRRLVASWIALPFFFAISVRKALQSLRNRNPL